MFSWIRRFFERRDVDGFKPSERLIYTYHNGIRWVNADPLILWERVMDVGPDLNVDIKVAQSSRHTAGSAKVAAVAKIRKIFNLKPLTETDGNVEVINTLSDTETCDLMDRFLNWVASLKKNSTLSPTPSSTPTGTLGARISAGGGSATPSTPDTGSAGSGSSSAVSESSPTAGPEPKDGLDSTPPFLKPSQTETAKPSS